MKVIELTLLVDDVDLEKRISDLEKRCGKLDISLQSIFAMTAATMPYKPFIDILLGFSDLKIYDIERTEKTRQFLDKFKIYKKSKEKEND